METVTTLLAIAIIILAAAAAVGFAQIIVLRQFFTNAENKPGGGGPSPSDVARYNWQTELLDNEECTCPECQSQDGVPDDDGPSPVFIPVVAKVGRLKSGAKKYLEDLLDEGRVHKHDYGAFTLTKKELATALKKLPVLDASDSDLDTPYFWVSGPYLGGSLLIDQLRAYGFVVDSVSFGLSAPTDSEEEV